MLRDSAVLSNAIPFKFALPAAPRRHNERRRRMRPGDRGPF